MGAIFQFDASAYYEIRIDCLRASKVGLWDVAHSCERPGSLDSNIKLSSIEPNSFDQLFAEYREIKTVFFNGRKSEELFRRKVLGKMPIPEYLAFQYLPSTSPAHAALGYEKKLACWSQAFSQV